MSQSEQKVVQYLDEARASERALVRTLQSQIAIAPRGPHRTGLESHLRETRDHARRLGERLRELDHGGGPLAVVGGMAESVVGQALVLAKAPLDLLRSSGGEEKVLKNAKDACAAEAREIATYTALERLAGMVGDEVTARLASAIKADEERMLERLLRELPTLTEAVVRADVQGERSYDLSETGVADAVREAGGRVAGSARTATARTARQARKVPGVARVEGAVKGALASEGDLAIPRYDSLTAEEVAEKLPALSQVDLAKVEVYERAHKDRVSVLKAAERERERVSA